MEPSIRQAIARVQQGEDTLREELIRQYIPFILKVTSQACKRFVRLGEDDEVSIALMAFNEALDKYDSNMNTSFFTFAQSVVKRRIIDYFRKAGLNKPEIPLSALLQEEGEDRNEAGQLDRITWQSSQKQYFEEDIAELRRDEIVEYNRELQEYGITFRELVEASPRHQDARVAAFKVARLISANEKYRRHLKKTRSLPLKELEEEVDVSRKTLERQRKYIIALAIVLMGRYYFLEEYLDGLKG